MARIKHQTNELDLIREVADRQRAVLSATASHVGKLKLHVPRRGPKTVTERRKLMALEVLMGIYQLRKDHNLCEVGYSDMMIVLDLSRPTLLNYARMLVADGYLDMRVIKRPNSLGNPVRCDGYSLTPKAMSEIEGLVRKYAEKYPQYFRVGTTSPERDSEPSGLGLHQ